MAVVWHDNGIRQYYSVWNGNRKYLPSIAVKASYVLLHQIDLILTVLAMSSGLFEWNPLIRNILDAPLQLMVVKLIIPLLIAWLIPARLLMPAIVFLSVVIGWNAKELIPLLL
ncbi:DUF5658 family protein [Chloroflexota bacterium]